jgi:hypothetical protein
MIEEEQEEPGPRPPPIIMKPEFYDYTLEDFVDLMDRIKNQLDLVLKSEVYESLGRATYDLSDIVKIVDHYRGRAVIKAFEKGDVKWK